MKKVISALTAATMVASMSASVMSAFAVYSESDMAFALKVNPDSYYLQNGTPDDPQLSYEAQTAKFTVSDDGKTITFATKEDAAGAKFGVDFYFIADPTKAAVQMIGGMLQTDNASVHLQQVGADLKASATNEAEKTYTAATWTVEKDEDDNAVSDFTLGAETTEFTASQFVNTFGYIKRGSYKHNTGDMSYSHNSEWAWASTYTGPESLLIQWTYGLNKKEGANSANTAAFLGAKSDDFPLTEVTVSLDENIADGVYNVTFSDTYEHAEYGTTVVSFVNGDGKTKVTPATMEGIKIVVGSEPIESDTETETESQEVPSDSETQPTETETESQEVPSETETQPTEATEPENFDSYTWKIADVEYTPQDADDYFYVPITVYNDKGLNGFQFKIKIDGKNIEDADCPFAVDEITDENSSYKFGQFQANVDNGFIAGTASGEGDQTNENGAIALDYILVPTKDISTYTPGSVYKIEFVTDDPDNAPTFANFAKETYDDVVLAAGSITIPGGEPVESGTETETETETESQEVPSESETQPSESETQPSESETQPSESETQPSESETQPSESETQPSESETQPGDYLYGDVNDNGTVELVDIVMLNRFLTKYDNQALNARQVENANCYENTTPGASTEANLDGLDSVEILKYLIGLISNLNPGH